MIKTLGKMNTAFTIKDASKNVQDRINADQTAKRTEEQDFQNNSGGFDISLDIFS